MAISIDFVNISSNIFGKQTNNSDQGARIRWLIVYHVAASWKKMWLKQRKFILEFAVIY